MSNEVSPPASQENPVDVQAFCVPEPKKSGLKKLTRFGKLAQWLKTPDEWATPNTCINYLEGIHWGYQLEPERALGYLTALEIWALSQVQKAGWRLREGNFWAWVPVIEGKIYKHLTHKPGGPSQKTLERMNDPLAAERKYKYRYRRINYGKKLLAQLQRVYEKDKREEGQNNFI